MKLAVLLATYNGEKYLRAQLDSLINQTYKDFIIYVSDDCSCDMTCSIVNEYVLKYEGKVFLINDDKKFGSAKLNFLYLIENVSADAYMFCDQDDVWDLEKISRTVAIYKENLEVSIPTLIYTDSSLVDSELNIIQDSLQQYYGLTNIKDLNEYYYLYANNIAGCTMFINRALRDMYICKSSYIEKENIIMHDYYFVLTAMLYGRIYYIDKSLMMYRQHSSNSVGVKNKTLSYFIKRLIGKEIKKNLVSCEKQLYEIMRNEKRKIVGKISESDLREFSTLYTKRKFYRIKQLKKLHFFTGNLSHKLIQLIFC